MNDMHNGMCFMVDALDMSERMDAEFHIPSLSHIEAQVTRKSMHHVLSDYMLSMNAGTPPKLSDDCACNLSEGVVPFIGVQNLTKFGYLNLDSYKEISRKKHQESLVKSQVHSGDLLIKTAGVGRMAVASVAPVGFEGNINQHVTVVKTESREITEYLCDYLNLDVVEAIAKRHSVGRVRPALDCVSLRNLPVVIGIDFAQLRKAKEAIKVAESQSVILGERLQSFLEDLLCVQKTSSNDEVLYYMQSYSELLGNSWTPNTINKQSARKEIDSCQLIEVCDLTKGQNITSKDVVNGEFEVVGGGQTSPYSSASYNTEPDSITISASGAYAGYVWYHDKPIFASDCIVVKAKDGFPFLTRFISEVLKANQQQIYSLQRGAGQPHIYMSDISQIRIPYMSLDKQKEIIAEIDRRRSEIREIKENAYRKYDKACEEINRYLLS